MQVRTFRPNRDPETPSATPTVTSTTPTVLGEESSSRSLIAQFQRFTENVPGADPLTLQTVEVVSDSTEGRALVSVGKGDFRVSRIPSTGELGVLEVRAPPAPPLHPRLCTPTFAPRLSAAPLRRASPPPHTPLRLRPASPPPPPPPAILFRSLPLLLCEKLSLPPSERFNLCKSNPLQGFHKVEVDGEGQPASKMPAPLRWSPAFLDPSLRISREADGTFSVYSKARVLVMCHACGVHTHTTRKTAHHTPLPPGHLGGLGRHAGCHRAACRDASGA